MSIDDLIRSDIINIKNADWNIRKGSVVPSTSSVALSNGAVELETTYIYADLANSSRMARHFDRRVTAKILKVMGLTQITRKRCYHGQHAEESLK